MITEARGPQLFFLGLMPHRYALDLLQVTQLLGENSSIVQKYH